MPLTMSGRRCAVLGCRNPASHRFPQNETMRKKWIEATKVDKQRNIGMHLKKHTLICSDHFKPADFTIYSRPTGIALRTKKNAVPSVFPWTLEIKEENDDATEGDDAPVLQNFASRVTKTYSRPLRPLTFVEEIPHMEATNDVESDPLQVSIKKENYIYIEVESMDNCTNDIKPDVFATPSDNTEIKLNNVSNICGKDGNTSSLTRTTETKPNEMPRDNKCIDAVVKKKVVDRSTLTDDSFLKESSVKVATAEKSIQADSINILFSIHTYKRNNKAMHHFTGLDTFEKVLLVFQSLGNKVNKLEYLYGKPTILIPPLEQFFMTLIIIKRHESFEEISMRYLIPKRQVENIFVSWVYFMAKHWRTLDICIAEDITDSCKSQNITLDSLTKDINTIEDNKFHIKQRRLMLMKDKKPGKAFLGITPNGFISYVSPCFDESDTDDEIFRKSSVLRLFDCSGVMEEDISDGPASIIGFGVKITLPVSFKTSNKRNKSSKYLHTAKIMDLLKTYKIITQPMNKTEELLASDILFICSMFVNFRLDLIINFI